ncbi:MAG: hypothetical protein IGS03_08790 [Candidatus Sericytochromatia bacterium]|nr:hypothetical protein [Candidatus Sericytochromatia bacterium]
MAVTRIQRNSTSPQTTETNARGHTEANTSKNPDATAAKTQFDNPVSKAELVKGNQGGTQKATAAGETAVYQHEQVTRIQQDVKPPGEASAQFKGDHYNPSSTIIRSKETDSNEGDSRDDKVKRKNEHESDEDNADQEAGSRKRRRPRQVGRRKGGAEGGEGGVPAVSSAPAGAGSLPQVQSSGGGPRSSLGVLKGAEVLEGQSSDMFQPSTSTQSSAKAQERSIREQISMYSLGAVGAAVFTAVAANADPNGENGMGPNMQKTLLNQAIEAMADAPDILSVQYREIVRELVQGTMQAAKENDIQTQGAIKMLVTSLMAVSPHDDDPKMMAEALKVISSEILYGKLNVGYSMKLAAYALGCALFMLSIYYKNYQKRIEYTKQLDQKLKYAVNDGIWEATGEITGYSEQHARENTDRFVAGRIEEEKDFQRNMFKGIILVPLKKLENVPFIRKLMSRFQKGS